MSTLKVAEDLGEPSISFEEIDPEIRKLVSLLNARPGVSTTWSCAGHSLGEEAYVSFEATTQDAVKDLLAALPFLGWQSGFCENRPVSKIIWMTADLSSNGNLRYDLRLGGYPEYARKELICEVERALSS